MSNVVVTMADAKRRANRQRRSKDVAALTAQSKHLVRGWAEQFKMSHRRTVEGVVAHGTLLNRGKAALSYGNFCKAIETAGLSLRTCEYYMVIANQPWAVPKNFSILPSSVSALRFLASQQREFVQELLDERRINAGMTKPELVALVDPPIPDEPPVAKPPRVHAPIALQLPKGINSLVAEFFNGASECDPNDADEVVWRQDDESIVFTAVRTGTVRFQNRVLDGAVVLFLLGPSFLLLYTGERRDHFVAAFRDQGIVMEAISSR
jgi:hypothetical protein